MTEIQNSKPACQSSFGHWILVLVIYLKFGACDLEFQ